MKTIPEFSVLCSTTYVPAEQASYSVDWIDGDARFHIWTAPGGAVIPADATIHKSCIAAEWIEHESGDRYKRKPNPAYFPHKALDSRAKVHAPLMAAIRELIADGSLACAAYDATVKREADKEAAARKAYADKVRTAFEGEADRLQLEGKGQVAFNIRQAVADLSEDQLIRVANIIRSA